MAQQRRDNLVSVVMTYGDGLPYGAGALAASVAAVLEQDYQPVELIIVDRRGPGADLAFLPESLRADRRVVHLPGAYANRAVACNAALQRASGALLLHVDNQAACVTLRRSAVRALVLAAARHRSAGLIYADYCRTDAHGGPAEVHLLDYHAGRLRDNLDFGPAILYRASVLEGLGGFDSRYAVADLYDLRLRIGEKHGLVHIGNRTGGSLYQVAAPPGGHNVFDYLLSDRDGQTEFEQALTEHLKRTGAYLPADRLLKRVTYSTAQQGRFDKGIASVVIPVNNRPEFIGRAVESALSQTVTNIEVLVVVNGGPSDPTIDQVRRYQPGGDRFDPTRPPVRLIVLDVNNIGLSLNAGIEAATGKFYVQLDSDDRLKPDAVEKLIAVFDSDPCIGMVIGSYELWELDPATGRAGRCAELPVVRHEEWTDQNGPNNLLRLNGAGAPRAAHIKVINEFGGFGVNDSPHSRNYGEDYDLVLKISERYRVGRVWDPIYEVLRHPGGTDHSIDQATIDRNDNAKDQMRLAALQRRQALSRSRGRGPPSAR
jgi:glycosyltransferase involved in cell wall biosynthesis